MSLLLEDFLFFFSSSNFCSSKEISNSRGSVSHSSQSSADTVLIPKFTITVLRPTWILVWTVWTCGHFTFSLSHCWVGRPGMFGTSWQKWKGGLPTSLLTQCPEGHITLCFVFVFVFCRLTPTHSFYFLIWSSFASQANLLIHRLYYLAKSCKKTLKWKKPIQIS